MASVAAGKVCPAPGCPRSGQQLSKAKDEHEIWLNFSLVSPTAAPVTHQINVTISLLFKYYIFFLARQPPVGKGVLIIEASRSHPDTSQLVGLLWTNDQPDAENSTWQHTSLTHGWIRTRNHSKRAAAVPRLRPRCHWVRHCVTRLS